LAAPQDRRWTPAPSPPGPPPQGRRRRAAAALVVVLLAAAWGAALVPPALAARAHLGEAREAVAEARALLLRGEAEAAVRAFDLAGREFRLARAALSGLPATAASWLPFLGRTPDAARNLATAGELLSRAGADLGRAVASLPGGLSTLTARDGALSLDALPPLEEAARRAHAPVASALELLRATRTWPAPGLVREATREALAEVATLERGLRAAAVVLQRLPAFLGAEGPRRYFVGGQNLAELRGSGGLVGAFAVLTADRGRLRFSSVRPIDALPTLPPERVGAPSEDYARNYNQFGGAGEWSNSNMTPDFPSAARAILLAYEAATGERLDGVILADAFALSSLMEVTGPVRVPALGTTVRPEDVVDYVSNRVYRAVPDSRARKTALGLLAIRVLERFLEGGLGSAAGLEALVGAVVQGHVRVYASDRALQRALEETGVDGSLAAPPGDVLAVVQNNGGANKIDYYLDRSVGYRVRLLPDGAARAAARVELANRAPTSGEAPEVIGPSEFFPRGGGRGENVAILNVYAAPSSRLLAARRDGEAVELRTGSERGLPYHQDYVRIASGQTVGLSLELAVGRAWQGDDARGAYRLTVLNQPTLRPTRLRVEVQAPPGMRVVEAGPGMSVRGDRAVWEGRPGPRLQLEVRFEAPWPLRVWRDVLRFLRRPVVRL
jgi:hypothetical protein